MSATVDAAKFSNYLDHAPILNVPGRTFPVDTRYLEDVIEITGFSGADGSTLDDNLADDSDDQDVHDAKISQLSSTLTTYSAKTRRVLKDFNEYRIPYDLILQLLRTVAKEPTYSDYSKAILVFLPGIAEIRRLTDMVNGDDWFRSGWRVYPLHSAISTEDQEGAFVIPPRGTRKIVIATNIAETGITIPDVTCVVDAGKHKEMRFFQCFAD